jgi:squalene synthase HpnC
VLLRCAKAGSRAVQGRRGAECGLDEPRARLIALMRDVDLRDQASRAGIRAKAGRENFPVASRFLPKATRRHFMAIYGFARLTDDTGDEADGNRLVLLDEVESELEHAFSGTASDPLFLELSETIVACNLSKEPFLDLIQANRQDQTVHRYETFGDLRDYCRLSADPVGRLVLGVAGRLTPERVRWSDDVCTALQLTEHWQDVAEDAARGRIYLPQEDLMRFGVEEGELLAPRATRPMVRLMAFEVDRARDLLRAALPLVGSLNGRMRAAVAGFAGGGHAALDAIQACGYDVLAHSARGRKSRLLLHSLRLLAGAGDQRPLLSPESTARAWEGRDRA